MLNILPFLTPLPQVDPNGGVRNGIAGLGQLQQKNEFNQKLEEQKRQYDQNFGQSERVNQEASNQFWHKQSEAEDMADLALAQWGAEQIAKDPTGKAAMLVPEIWKARGFTQEAVPPENFQYKAPVNSYMPPAMPATQGDPAQAAQQAQQIIQAASDISAPNEDQALAQLETAQKARDLSESQDTSVPDQKLTGDEKALPPPQAPQAAPQQPQMPQLKLPSEGMTGYSMRVSMPIERPQGAPVEAPQGEALSVSQPKPASAPMRFRTRSGRSFEVNPGAMAAVDKSRSAGAGAALSNIMPEEDRKWAAARLQEAIGSGAIRTPEQVVDFFVSAIQPELLQKDKTRGAIALSMSRNANQAGVNADRDRTRFDDELNRLAGQKKFQAIEMADQAASKMKELIAVENPLADKIAFATNLQAAFKGATSDRELVFMQSAGGLLNRIEQKINDYLGRGELPPDYKQLMAQANEAIQGGLQKERDEFVARAVKAFEHRGDMTGPIPQWREYIADRFGGHLPKAPAGRRASASSSPAGTGSPAPQGGQAPAKQDHTDEAAALLE